MSSGKRCFQIAYDEFKCVNTITPRGGIVRDVNPVFARATATLDQMINEAITGGQKKKKDTGELDRLIDRATEPEKEKKKSKDKDDEEEDEDKETTTKTPTTPAKTTTPAAVTTPPPAATTTGGPTRVVEWIKANPPFAIIIAGLVLYIVMRGGR